MSSIRVNWQSLSDGIERCSDHRTTVSDAIATVRSVKSYRGCMSGRAFTEIYRRLDDVIEQLEIEKKDLQQLKTGLADVKNAYTTCETGVCEQIQSQEAQKDKKSENPFKFEWSDMADEVAGLGLIGSVVSVIGNFITGKWSDKAEITKSLANIGKSVVSGVDHITGAVLKEGGIKANWKEALFGGIENVRQSTSIGSQLKELSWTAAKTTADKAKVIASWAGIALSGLANAADNYKEFGGFSGEMAAETVVETITETAVGIGAKAAAGTLVAWAASAGAASGVAGIAGLAGVLATPVGAAVAVAAGTVAITWVANGACKWITGALFHEQRDIKEVFADTIVGTGKKIYDTGKKVVGAVGDAVSSAGKTVSKWWNSVFRKPAHAR